MSIIFLDYLKANRRKSGQQHQAIYKYTYQQQTNLHRNHPFGWLAKCNGWLPS
jgi:hypothetical protein